MLFAGCSSPNQHALEQKATEIADTLSNPTSDKVARIFGSVDLPEEISDVSVSWKVETVRARGNSGSVELTASVGGSSLVLTIDLKRNGDEWKVTGDPEVTVKLEGIFYRDP